MPLKNSKTKSHKLRGQLKNEKAIRDLPKSFSNPHELVIIDHHLVDLSVLTTTRDCKNTTKIFRALRKFFDQDFFKGRFEVLLVEDIDHDKSDLFHNPRYNPKFPEDFAFE